jgi:hypothetical protein
MTARALRWGRLMWDDDNAGDRKPPSKPLMSDDDNPGDRKPPSKPALRWGPKKRVIIRRVPAKWRPVLPPKIDRPKPNPSNDGDRKPPSPRLDPAKIPSVPLLETTSSNIIDFEKHRPRVEERLATTPVAPKPEAPLVTCFVIRRGQRNGQKFDFCAVPAVGRHLFLGWEQKKYVVVSVTHLAVETGTGQPFVHVHVRLKKKKR